MSGQKQQQPKIEWGFYAVVPRVVRTQYKNLSHAEKWLYTCLKDLCGDKGTCFRTLRSLSEETDISIGSLSTMIPHLHDEGLIHAEKKRRSPKGKEVWHITIADIWQSNHEYCSKIERTASDVQEMNNDVQKLNEPTPDRSEIEPHCSNFVDRRITHKNNKSEEYKDEEESTFPDALTSSTTCSSDDSHTHALSSLSSEPERSSDARHALSGPTVADGTHQSVFAAPANPVAVVGVAQQGTSLLASSFRQAERGASTDTAQVTAIASEQGKAESRIANTTESAQAEPSKPTRKPRAPRKPKTPLQDLDEETRARVVKVLDCLDSWRQEISGNPDQCYSREDTAAIEAIVKILPLKPTPKRLRQVCDAMWNTPPDSRSGFHWKKHMTVVNICKQYDTQSLELDAKEKKATQYSNISILPVTATKDDDDDNLVFIGPRSQRMRKRG